MSSSTVPNLSHGVCNNSSLAAVTTADGIRHVFFQDVNGALRQMQLSTTTQTWATSMNFVIPNTTDAKQNTPMSAIVLEQNSDVTTPILLLYVSQDYHLAATLFNYQDSQNWENATTFFNLSQYVAALSSKSLEVVQVPGTNSSSKLSLWYEDSSGRAIGLLGTHASILPTFNLTINEPFWPWNDSTATLEANASITTTTIGAPFAISPSVYYLNSSIPSFPFGELVATFHIPNATLGMNALYANYINGTWRAGKYIWIATLIH